MHLLPDKPTEADEFIRGVLPKSGLQPGFALHPEQPQVRTAGMQAVPSHSWVLSACLARLLMVIWTLLTLLCFTPSIAADFLPTFMYCLGSRDFEVVQTALRNLPEYTLLCQGTSVFATFGACLASQRSELGSAVFPFHRARSGVTAQSLPGGDVRPDRHQLSDFRGLEGSAHGGHDMSVCFWELHFQRS